MCGWECKENISANSECSTQQRSVKQNEQAIRNEIRRCKLKITCVLMAEVGCSMAAAELREYEILIQTSRASISPDKIAIEMEHIPHSRTP
ncbi:hypothetical protein DMENIID0001_090040 [Sergentomyia squamirostris]